MDAVVSATITSMLLPRYSLRTTLALITGASFFFVVVGLAVRGHAWAVAVSVAVASGALALAAYAISYGVCIALAGVVGSQEIVAKTSRGAVLRDTGAPTAEARESS